MKLNFQTNEGISGKTSVFVKFSKKRFSFPENLFES